MTEAELQALSVLVEAHTMEGVAANVGREHRGESLAYEDHPRPDLLLALESELKQRGVLPSQA